MSLAPGLPGEGVLSAGGRPGPLRPLADLLQLGLVLPLHVLQLGGHLGLALLLRLHLGLEVQHLGLVLGLHPVPFLLKKLLAEA